MADRYRAAVDVEFVVVDAELVAAIDHLTGERFIQFPEADVRHSQAIAFEQLRNREHRTDAHLVRLAAGNREATIDTERLEATTLGLLAAHQHRDRYALRPLRGIAGGAEIGRASCRESVCQYV